MNEILNCNNCNQPIKLGGITIFSFDDRGHEIEYCSTDCENEAISCEYDNYFLDQSI